jgi:alcohol dehydrogenase (cytochrome c)
MNVRVFAAAALALLSLPVAAQQPLDPSLLLKPTPDSWPTYNGDYSGRRYSPLTSINAGNIDALGLAWAFRLPADNRSGAATSIKATPLLVHGILYFAVPDHVWAVDARSGREVWHFRWESNGGIHIGNRGVGILGNWLYFETPDCHLVSLDIRTGKERWRQEICDLNQYYYGSVAPVIVKNHVLVGVSGDDLDIPGYLEARDPESGALQWRWYVPARPGEPGAESWPSEDAMLHGGGMTWVPSTYDPDLNLIYLGTGNPQPVLAGKGRKGDNLYTESIVALNPDTGKLAWAFQSSPHDTHDWDAVQTPVLFDADIDGRPRKLLAQASRNGYFFVLDRTTGKNVLTKPFIKTNWASGIDSKGQPTPDPAKEPTPAGTLVSPNSSGASNWYPPSLNPQTGLFYVSSNRSFSMFYLTDLADKPQGWGGNDRGGYSESYLQAIDYRTGQVKWMHRWYGGGLSGLLSTAGGLLFSGDTANHLVALNPSTGDILWHAGLTANVSNGPITYEIDGRQYLVVGAGDTLYGFWMIADKESTQRKTR